MLGDLVHRALALAGITPARVSRWLGRPCGCEERRAKLNALTAWAGRVIMGKLKPTDLHRLLDEDSEEVGHDSGPG